MGFNMVVDHTRMLIQGNIVGEEEMRGKMKCKASLVIALTIKSLLMCMGIQWLLPEKANPYTRCELGFLPTC